MNITGKFEKVENLRIVEAGSKRIIIKSDEWKKIEQLLNGEIKRRNFVNIEARDRKEYQVQLENGSLIFVTMFGNNIEIDINEIDINEIERGN